MILSSLLLAFPALPALLAVPAASGTDEAPARGYYVYVAAESEDVVALARFDPASGTLEVTDRVPVGYQPTEIEGPHGLTVAPDGRHWYLTMAHGRPFGILYKYTTGTNELVGQCELGLFPATMQVSPATGLLYCVNFDLHGKMGPSSVSIVDPEQMVEVARTVTGPMPHGSRISPDGLRHYSCSMMGDQLFEIDAASFALRRTLALTVADEPAQAGHAEHPAHAEHAGHGAHGRQVAPPQETPAGDAQAGHGHHTPQAKPTWVFPHPSEPKVYVALNGAAQVVEVDTEEWRIVRRFATDKGPYNVEVSRDGQRMLTTHKSAQSVGVWDLPRGVELARIPSSRRIPHGVVLSPDSRYAFVSCEAVGSEPGTLDVIDLATNERVATADVGLQAGGIAFWKID